MQHTHSIETTPFWTSPPAALFQQLNSCRQGLGRDEAARRLAEQKRQRQVRKAWQRNLLLLLSQYSNPLVLLLVLAVILSTVLGEYSNGLIIFVVLLLTGLLGYIQERNAGRAIEKLQSMVRSTSTVCRQGAVEDISPEAIVPGDIVVVNAGDIIPADCLVLEANDLHVNESALTGESFPVEKFPGQCVAGTPVSQAGNAVFRGTSVVNGSATLLAVRTGQETQLGKITILLEKQRPANAFEKGIHQFGYLLMRLTVVIALLVLTLHILLGKPMVGSLLFALALAVGLAPELLPAIVTITLSAGARRMAGKKVIVKKLSAIQSLGEMNILCCDKTGTLTAGVVQLSAAVDVTGQPSEKVLQYVYLNAVFESGFPNALDESVRRQGQLDTSLYTKRDEVPYDFIRKRLSIVAGTPEGRDYMITKGAVPNILSCCTQVELPDRSVAGIDGVRDKLETLFAGYCGQGLRTLGVCYKDVSGDPVINKDDETDMTFLGFVTFKDVLKEGIETSIGQLGREGIRVKLITGDHELVARQVAGRIGMDTTSVMTGRMLNTLGKEGLQRKVDTIDVYAEIEPVQKERIIRALQSNGHVVGFLGDGINDAGALKAADAGISIDNAVEVAREAASLVLLEKDIEVIREGVLEGRKTFANTLKYIYVTTSANFGNMFSMAIASLALPFLPLLPIQILLNNFLSDLPALAIASDKVDAEMMQQPRRWNLASIKRFMILFGLQSSLFDLLTFSLLLYVFRASVPAFRSGWFMESLLTEILVLLVIRTRRPFFRSHPSRYLLMASLFTFLCALLLPYLPFAGIFGLQPLPIPWVFAILGLSLAYVVLSEFTKRWVIREAMPR